MNQTLVVDASVAIKWVVAEEFSEVDRRTLESLAARATAAIYRQKLRQEAELRAAELEAVIENIADVVFVGDTEGIRRALRRHGAARGASRSRGIRDVLRAEPDDVRRPFTFATHG